MEEAKPSSSSGLDPERIDFVAAHRSMDKAENSVCARTVGAAFAKRTREDV